MTKTLKIADGLNLPLDAVTGTFAIMAIRGVGKTHTASVMAEEMLKAGQPVCVYDPTGAWYGLKSSADGRGPGFPVVVFGGEHADVPLEPTAGETIARVVVDRRAPAILDVSLMRKGERVRFMTDFCETLYHRNREPLHFFADEAHTIAPQKPLPETARLLGAVEDIILQGRRRGLGMTVISQRPALVNTNIRTQCATLIAMRIMGPHDLRAIQEWTDAHGTPEQAAEMIASLPTLKVGEGWVWSPALLNTFRRVRFRRRETFDSSATPEVGKRVVTPKVMAEIDLAALGAEIKATVEKAKADDPKALRAEVAKLRAELARVPAAAPAKVERVEVPVLKDGQIDKLNAVVAKLQKVLETAGDHYQLAISLRDGLAVAIRSTAPKPAPAPVGSAAAIVERALAPRPPVAPRPAHTVNGLANGDLPKGERAVLTAIAQTAGGCSPEQLTVLTGYKRSSRDTYLQRLRERGYTDRSGDAVVATDAGVAALGDGFEPLPTGDALRAHWLGKLPEGERRVLEALVAAHPSAVSRERVDEATGYKRSSRDTYLQRLGSRRLVESVGRGEVRAADVLFG